MINSSPEVLAVSPSNSQNSASGQLALVTRCEQRVVTVDDVMSMGWKRLLLLLIVPVAAAAIAYGIAGLMMPRYTSIAYLKLDAAGARAADALMASSLVTDKVKTDLGMSQNQVDRQPKLNNSRRIIAAAGDLQSTAELFRLEYSDEDPRVAQRVNSLFIRAWLASAGPSAEQRDRLDAEIQRRNDLVKDISEQITWAVRDLSPRVLPEKQNDVLIIIKNLLEKREQQVDQISAMMAKNRAVRPDAVFGSPDLPVKPSWPEKRIIAILAGVITALFLVVLVAFGLSRNRTKARAVAQRSDVLPNAH